MKAVRKIILSPEFHSVVFHSNFGIHTQKKMRFCFCAKIGLGYRFCGVCGAIPQAVQASPMKRHATKGSRVCSGMTGAIEQSPSQVAALFTTRSSASTGEIQ